MTSSSTSPHVSLSPQSVSLLAVGSTGSTQRHFVQFSGNTTHIATESSTGRIPFLKGSQTVLSGQYSHKEPYT